MSKFTEFDWPKLPVREGEAQGNSIERKALFQVSGPDGIRTRVLNTQDVTVRLKTRGGNPEFVTERRRVPVAGQTPFIPDWLSGVMTSGFSLDGKHFGPYFAAPDSVMKFALSEGTPYVMERLNVGLADSHFIPPAEVTDANLPYSQYAVIQPYRYSGKMRALVQFILGYGRIKYPSWYSTHFVTPSSTVSTEKAFTRKQVAYGYSFSDCHGIAIGADGSPWLIWISSSQGVWAFDLPRIYGSDDPAFYAALADTDPNDTAGMMAWPAFKGFPTGERPEVGDLAQWVASGCGYQLLTTEQMSGWADCGALSDHLGWAFKYDGSEARCVGKKTENNGLDYTALNYYRLTISIGEKRALETGGRSLAALRKRMLKPGVAAHVRAKLMYMTEAKAAEVLGGITAFVDVINAPALTAQPSATCTLLSSGGFYPPPGEVKVWSDAVGGCVSLSLSPEPTNPADYSGPFHVFYSSSGTLYEIKWGAASGSTGSGPYCNEYDTRDKTGGSSAVVVTSQEDAFNVHHYAIGSSPASDLPIDYVRAWNVTTTTETVSTSGHTNAGTCFVPCGDRESVVLAKKHTHNGGTHQYAYNKFIKSDKRAYRVGFIYSTSPPIYPNGQSVTSAGCTFNFTGEGQGDWIFVANPLDYYPSNTLNPNGVDSGEWAVACFHPQDDVISYGQHNTTDTRTNHTDAEPARGTFECVAIVGGELRTIKDVSDTPAGINALYTQWFTSSPDPGTNVLQVMRTTANCFGAAYAQCYDDLNSGRYIHFGVLPMTVENADDAHLNYIGVIP
ncbi:MAG TPA: hypothetical protein PK782_14350 [Nitrospira sp.]|nr:hypothetical protein [Nitrospira sp.]